MTVNLYSIILTLSKITNKHEKVKLTKIIHTYLSSSLLVEHKALHSFLQFSLYLTFHSASCHLDHSISCLSLLFFTRFPLACPSFFFLLEPLSTFVISSLLNMCPVYDYLLFLSASIARVCASTDFFLSLDFDEIYLCILNFPLLLSNR